VRRFVEEQDVTWQTAYWIAGVTSVEDARWRDAVDAAEQSGEDVPEAEAEWFRLWERSQITIAGVAGNLAKRAAGTGKDAVHAAKALLPVEVGGGWASGGGGNGGGQDDARDGVDEVATERLSPAQRRQVAELAATVLAARDELDLLLRDARMSVR
jgi:hypothetical protein